MSDIFQDDQDKYASVGNKTLQHFENAIRKAPPSVGELPLSNKSKSFMYAPRIIQEADGSYKIFDQQPQAIIIGDDDRREVDEKKFPARCIAYLEIEDQDGYTFPGTGFFISPRCVITAGHCVHADRRWVKKVTVYPGLDGTNPQFGSATSDHFRSVTGWVKDQESQYDHGAVILDDDMLYNNIQCFLGYDLLGNDREVQITGYPIDRSKTQWEDNGKIARETPHKLFYEIDTKRGNSGSPIYITKANIFRQVVGIHTDGNTLNSGIKLTQDLMDRWAEWTNL